MPRPANIQIGTMWYESFDYAQRLRLYHDHQAFVAADGVFRALVAHHDPGLPTWLNTGGFGEGVLLCRFHFPERSAPQPQTRVVAFDRLAAVLPPETPRLDPSVPREEIARRRRGLARRCR